MGKNGILVVSLRMERLGELKLIDFWAPPPSQLNPHIPRLLLLTTIKMLCLPGLDACSCCFGYKLYMLVKSSLSNASIIGFGAKLK